ncbi:MAG TPA: alanine racemase, partial [Spirochaetia bacterium]|nr:alanine racemase [Spirochaetia bacterium]
MIEALSNGIKDRYKYAVGRSRRDIPTPALILDVEVARRNIEYMARRFREFPTALRPHIKVQKCAELARMQVEAGAIGVCTATVWEAIVMSRAGIEDVLVANQVVGRQKIQALAGAAKKHRLTVAIDCTENSRDLSAAVTSAGSSLEVLIEVDVGMGRGGVRSAEEALNLARDVSKLPGLTLRGVQGYEGHCMLEPDRELRIRKAREAMDFLKSVVDLLKREGFECPVVSAGGTGTYDITGQNPFITEIQAGSYVFMDKFHGNLVPGFANSLTVLGTVIIQHGNTIVLDSGRKSV